MSLRTVELRHSFLQRTSNLQKLLSRLRLHHGIGQSRRCLLSSRERRLLVAESFYAKEFAEDLMLHLLVEDVDPWWFKLDEQGISKRYSVKQSAVVQQPWHMRDFVLYDPSRILWRIGEKHTVGCYASPTNAAPCERWHLTLHRRSKGRFAPFGRPLMSNVRRQKKRRSSSNTQESPPAYRRTSR